MPAAAYPLNLRTILRAGKSRNQPAAFRMAEPRRGYGYAQATGTDTPVFWDVAFRFTTAEAALFQLWFTQTIQRGLLEFTMPIRTEFGLITHTCRFLPDGLLNAQEDGEIWVYSAKIMARAQIIPDDAITQYSAAFADPIPHQTSYAGVAYSVALAGYWTGGAGPFTYALVAGSMPPGITLNAATGVLSGTTTAEDSTVKSGLIVRRFGAYGLHNDSNPFTFTASASSVPTDPSFSAVSLLMHMDGTSGSTAYVDSSGFAHAITGNVPITSSNPKFGSGAALSDGGAKALVVADHPSLNFGSGNFTIEGFFARSAVVAAPREIISKGTSRGTASTACFSIVTDSENFTVRLSDGSTIVTVFHSTFMETGVYFHWAVVRSGSSLVLYLNGIERLSATFTGSVNSMSEPIRIFEPSYQTNSSPGRLDELRITKGLARYTGNFTPPTGPFPSA